MAQAVNANAATTAAAATAATAAATAATAAANATNALAAMTARLGQPITPDGPAAAFPQDEVLNLGPLMATAMRRQRKWLMGAAVALIAVGAVLYLGWGT